MFLHAVFRNGRVATRNGQRRYFCGEKEPFAFLVTGSYAQVRVYSYYYYYQMTFKAAYFTMNNGKLTIEKVDYFCFSLLYLGMAFLQLVTANGGTFVVKRNHLHFWFREAMPTSVFTVDIIIR